MHRQQVSSGVKWYYGYLVEATVSDKTNKHGYLVTREILQIIVK